MSTPRVFTYHCAFCSHLVFASTHPLASLPRRRAPGLDHAHIFPLPPPPKTTNDEDDDNAEAASLQDKDSYTLLLTLTRDRAPKIITREDGFEKRYIWKCGRCKLIMGYQLDEIHYELGPKTDTIGTVILGGGEAGAGKDRALKEKERAKKKGERWLYVLPGAVLGTEDLRNEGMRVEVELGGN